MKSSFLPGCAHMRPIVGAQRGELLPRVARHPRDQRALAVHDLVVRERQHEVLGERIHEAERDLVVVPLAVHRRAPHVGERVVHPPHVPLEAEPEAAGVGRARHARPGGRLLGERHHAGMLRVDGLVQLAQERDRLEVLVAAEPVRPPLAGLARVVEVEHRRDRVDAQPVDVIALEPEQRVGDEVVDDFLPTEVVDGGVPVGLEADARIARIRRARCRRIARGRAGRPESARAPSRGSRRFPPRGSGRRSARIPPGRRSAPSGAKRPIG